MFSPSTHSGIEFLAAAAAASVAVAAVEAHEVAAPASPASAASSSSAAPAAPAAAAPAAAESAAGASSEKTAKTALSIHRGKFFKLFVASNATNIRSGAIAFNPEFAAALVMWKPPEGGNWVAVPGLQAALMRDLSHGLTSDMLPPESGDLRAWILQRLSETFDTCKDTIYGQWAASWKIQIDSDLSRPAACALPLPTASISPAPSGAAAAAGAGAAGAATVSIVQPIAPTGGKQLVTDSNVVVPESECDHRMTFLHEDADAGDVEVFGDPDDCTKMLILASGYEPGDTVCNGKAYVTGLAHMLRSNVELGGSKILVVCVQMSYILQPGVLLKLLKGTGKPIREQAVLCMMAHSSPRGADVYGVNTADMTAEEVPHHNVCYSCLSDALVASLGVGDRISVVAMLGCASAGTSYFKVGDSMYHGSQLLFYLAQPPGGGRGVARVAVGYGEGTADPTRMGSYGATTCIDVTFLLALMMVDLTEPNNEKSFHTIMETDSRCEGTQHPLAMLMGAAQSDKWPLLMYTVIYDDTVLPERASYEKGRRPPLKKARKARAQTRSPSSSSGK